MTVPKLRLVEQRSASGTPVPSDESTPAKRSAKSTKRRTAEKHAEASAVEASAVEVTPPSGSKTIAKKAKPSETKPKRAAGVTSKAAPRARKNAPTASDVMRSDVKSCSPKDSINVAARLLWDHDLGALVVVDDDDKPVSVITDRDICFAAYTQGVPLWESAVESAMSKHLVTCKSSTPVPAVRQLMLDAQVRRVPVVDDDGKLVGMIGLKDLCAEALTPPAKGRKRASSAAEVLQLVGGLLASEPAAGHSH